MRKRSYIQAPAIQGALARLCPRASARPDGGQWVATDDGWYWYWDSDEPLGWAAYYYCGRWVDDPYSSGRVSFPGTEWAPAWVSWRHGNGSPGWAPRPPRAAWRTQVGPSIGGVDIDAFLGAGDYAFVRDRSFMNRGLQEQVLPSTETLRLGE